MGAAHRPIMTADGTQSLGWGTCVVMVHHTKLLLSRAFTFASVAAIVYLSPYSPDFSPIENCCSSFSAHVRHTYAQCKPSLMLFLP